MAFITFGPVQLLKISALLHWIGPSLSDVSLLKINSNKNHVGQINFTLPSQSIHMWKGVAKEKSFWNQRRNTQLWNMGNKQDSRTEETETCEGAASLDPGQMLHPLPMAKSRCRIKLMNEKGFEVWKSTYALKQHNPKVEFFYIS